MIEAIEAKPSKRDFVSIAIGKAKLTAGSGGTSEINGLICALQPFLFFFSFLKQHLKVTQEVTSLCRVTHIYQTNKTKSGTNLFAFLGRLSSQNNEFLPSCWENPFRSPNQERWNDEQLSDVNWTSVRHQVPDIMFLFHHCTQTTTLYKKSLRTSGVSVPLPALALIRVNFLLSRSIDYGAPSTLHLRTFDF